MDIFKQYVGITGYTIEATGVLIIVIGTFGATVWFLISLKKFDITKIYGKFRIILARVILLGLEFLLAGDIIRTVVIAPTLEQVGVLTVIVLIRTFLSFTLELEIEGAWPWQRQSTKLKERL